MKNNKKSICGVTSDGWLVFPAKLLLYLLSICYCWIKNHFSEFKTNHKLICLWASTALELWYNTYENQQNINMWSDWWCWCFHPNYCYIHFQYAIVWWKIIFQHSKIPQTHLLMSFNSIRIMVQYIWKSTKN